MRENYRVVLADDHNIVREGLKLLLSTLSETVVVGEVGDCSSLLRLLAQTPCDMVLLDLGMPGFHGFQFIEQLRATHPKLKILILSANSESRSIRAALDAGASGYLTKDGDPSELLATIANLKNGRSNGAIHIGSSINRPNGHEPGPNIDVVSPVPLTRRELQFLALIPQGATTREIADRLGISVFTARKHRENLMRKLDLHSSAELTAYAVRLGLPSA
ncbi:response regulator [Ochrobactrum sp. BTU1]|jgi:DNA-binding NarL/FixJ family response regulator|uniref:response regulator n=1 Tax=Ochrobactrum sp. BTU1 TaxID=2840456 RepID=UPI001C05AF5E|nr:response regulator transcription factor [Ochrobactrum sp. BTU1]